MRMQFSSAAILIGIMLLSLTCFANIKDPCSLFTKSELNGDVDFFLKSPMFDTHTIRDACIMLNH